MTTTAKSMSEPVRIGFVGHGTWFSFYLAPPLRDRADVVLAAVCGRDLSRAQAAASAFGINAAYDSVEAMVAAENLDVIVVSTPPSEHLDACRIAAAAGVHVFCEKPLGLNRIDTAQMVGDARHVRTMVGFTQRWSPANEVLRNLVADGTVGEVRHVAYRFAQAGASDPTGAWAWRHDSLQYPGGVLSDLGPHAIDMVGWLLGRMPETVLAAGRNPFTTRVTEDGERRAVTGPEDVDVSLRYAAGVGATLSLTRFAAPWPDRMFLLEAEVIGTEATVAVSSQQPGVLIARPGTASEVRPVDHPGDDVLEQLAVGASRQAIDLVAMARGADAMVTCPTFKQAHDGQCVLDAAIDSLRTGAETAVPAP